MSTIKTLNNQLERYFSPIGLDDVNKKAALLQRKDNKYLVSRNTFLALLKEASADFDILTIGEDSIFAYSTMYYDDSNYQCYLDHHNGRRCRVKVRERLYEQSQLIFLEVKLKSKRKATVKYRTNSEPEADARLNSDKVDFINQKYKSQYSRDFDMALTSSLAMRYFRFTLVAKNSSERVTVDSQLCFVGKTSLTRLDDEQLIIEVKSKNGSGSFDKLLRKNGFRSKSKLSKYCLGLCLTDKPIRDNNFLKRVRDLNYTKQPNLYGSIRTALHQLQTDNANKKEAELV